MFKKYLKSRTSILQNTTKPFSPNSFLLVAPKAAGDCCRLPFQTTAEAKVEEEANASVAAAEEIREELQ